jgi:hypothetical protein
MAAPRREFKNIDVLLDNGEMIRFGTHKAKDGTMTVKLRLPGEWSVDQLFRGANNAQESVLVVTRSA